MLFVGPVSFRKRDKRVAALIRRGHATDDEMFEAQYGEWPVKGLHKDTPRDNIVHFNGFSAGPRSMAFSPFTMGYVDKEEEGRNIYINRLTLNPLSPVTGALTSRMMYARLHDVLEPLLGIELLKQFSLGLFALSLGSSYRYAVISSLTKLLAPSVSDVAGEEHIHVMQFKDGFDSTSRRAFLNDVHNILGNRKGLARVFTEVSQTLDMVLTLMPREHYMQDHEQEANLHKIMVRGYKGWGKIPESEDELFAALTDMGVRRPKIVNQYMRDDGQKDVRGIFYKHAQTGYVSPPVAELNIGLNAPRSDELLLRYWKDYLSLQYASLRLKYGDSHAFERMGFTSDPDSMMGLPVRITPSPLEIKPY